jgi:hypothetical protein
MIPAGTASTDYTLVVAAVAFGALLVSTATVLTLRNSPWSATESQRWFLVGIAFCEVNAVLLSSIVVYLLFTGRQASVIMLIGSFGVFLAVLGGYQQTRSLILTGHDFEDI